MLPLLLPARLPPCLPTLLLLALRDLAAPSSPHLSPIPPASPSLLQPLLIVSNTYPLSPIRPVSISSTLFPLANGVYQTCNKPLCSLPLSLPPSLSPSLAHTPSLGSCSLFLSLSLSLSVSVCVSS